MAAKGSEQAALPAGEDDKKQKKPSRGKRIIIALIVLLTLAAAGGGGYWWLYMRAPAAPEAADAARDQKAASTDEKPADVKAEGDASHNVRIERQSDLPRSGGIVVPLPSITVNLADPAGRRYLKIGMEVELNEDVTAQLQQQAPRVRDAIIMLLAGKTYGDVATPDGKVLLKGEVAARLNQILGAQRVIRVYFTDFVVQ